MERLTRSGDRHREFVVFEQFGLAERILSRKENNELSGDCSWLGERYKFVRSHKMGNTTSIVARGDNG